MQRRHRLRNVKNSLPKLSATIFGRNHVESMFRFFHCTSIEHTSIINGK